MKGAAPEPALKSGDVIAWRNCPRDQSRRHAPSFAIGMRVVSDVPGELVLYRGPGYPMRRRNAEREIVPAFRHQPTIRFLDGWTSERDWSRWHVLVVMDPTGRHATSIFRDAANDRFEFWYVDVIGPVTRAGRCFDFVEHGLDVVVSPDLTRWDLKDDDELDWNVVHGVYTSAEADELRAEARRAVDELRRERARFERWLSWRPDPSWTAPVMPAGWDRV